MSSNVSFLLTELDSNVTLEFILEANSVNAGDGFDDGGLSVSDMADCSNIDCSLSGYHLGRLWRQFCNILKKQIIFFNSQISRLGFYRLKEFLKNRKYCMRGQ